LSHGISSLQPVDYITHSIWILFRFQNDVFYLVLCTLSNMVIHKWHNW